MNSRVLSEAAGTEQHPAQNLSEQASGWLMRLRSLESIRLFRFGTVMAYVLTVTILIFGWMNRDDIPLTAEEGTGYWLGIIGGSMMLALLLYPLRKKKRFMQFFGPVKYWFRMHMVFGVLGPVLIIYHSTFSLGSLNSTVAFTCMLVVAGSGLVGRFFYARIHYGLYGRIATLKQLREDDETIHEQLKKLLEFNPELLQQMDQMVESIVSTDPQKSESLSKSFGYGLKLRWIYFIFLRTVRKALKEEQSMHGWRPVVRKEIIKSVREKLGTHLSLVRKIGQLRFYERMFSLWHILHFPLFIMLVISGVVHVIAVHAY